MPFFPSLFKSKTVDDTPSSSAPQQADAQQQQQQQPDEQQQQLPLQDNTNRDSHTSVAVPTLLAAQYDHASFGMYQYRYDDETTVGHLSRPPLPRAPPPAWHPYDATLPTEADIHGHKHTDSVVSMDKLVPPPLPLTLPPPPSAPSLAPVAVTSTPAMPAAAYAATPRMSVTFAPRTSSLQPPGFSSKPYDAATASNTVDTRDDASFAKHERPAACSQCCGGCAPCACGLFGWHLMGPKSSSPVVHSNLPAELWRGSATSSLIGTFEQRLRDSYRAKWVLVIFDLLIMLPAMALLSFLVLVWLDQIENAGIYRIINTNVLVISTAWTLLATVVGIFGLWSISRGSKAKSVLFALMLLGVLGLQIATGYVSYKWLNEPHFETNMAQRFSREYSNQSRALIQSSFECCGFWSDFDSPTVDGNQCFRNIVPGLLGSRPPSPPPPANPTQFFPPPRRPGATTSGVPSATATPPPPPTGQPRPTGSPTSSISASRPTSTQRGEPVDDEPVDGDEPLSLTSAANVAVSKQATTKRSQAGIARRHSTRVLARRQLANTPTQPQPQPSAQPSDQQRQQQSQSEQPGTPGCWPKLKAFSSGYLTMFYTMAFSHMAVTIVTLTASLMSINRFTS